MDNAGNLLIIITLFLSVVSLGLAAGTEQGRKRLEQPSRIVYYCASAGILAAAALLMYYFIGSDFRFEYVFANSSRDLFLPYRIAAFWAGKEGSFLLWLVFVNIFGIIALRSKNELARIAWMVIIISQIFILIVLIVESPFTYIWTKYPDDFSPGLFPGDGAGLNPLLKDPWMVTHPPALFLGYASATIPFAYAVAALVKKEYRGWADAAYPWLLFSMTTLGIGIFLGGYWAYAVLGWGGYWGWDPVENSSLIPWLVSVALVHGFIIQRRHGGLARVTIGLAILYFILVFYSTWLTRSGVLSNFSVHSFSASVIASYLLGFLLLYFIISAVLYAVRFVTIRGERIDTPLTDWKTLTVYGIIVLVIFAFIILAGTSMPILSQLLAGRPSNVTSEFYNSISRPLGIVVIVLMVASTVMAITKIDKILEKSSIAAAIIAVLAGTVINWGFFRNPFAIIISVLALFLVLRAGLDLWKVRSRALLPSRIAHIGIGLLALGVVTSGFQSTSVQKKLVQGEKTVVDSLEIVFTGFVEGKESYLRFTVRSNSKPVFAKTSYYFDEKTESIYKEPFIIPGFVNDIYIAPEAYESGSESLTKLVIGKGETKELGGLKFVFKGFRTEHMTSGEPSTFADLTVNGMPLSPGIKLKRDKHHFIDQTIPGTDRTVSLREIDASNKRILISVSPGKNMVIPPDAVIISVTRKRLIWLVWLGTILIATGGAYAFYRSVAAKRR